MPQTWSKTLEIRRCELDLTQQQAAELIGVPLNTYGRWERGQAFPLSIYRKQIARAFNMKESEIF